MRQMLCVALLAFCPLAFSATCPSDQPKDGSALVQMEHTWAKALEAHDVQAMDCILAENFEDIGVYGEVHNRGQALAAIAHRRPGSNQLSALTPYVHGDFGYIRGLATLVSPEGKAVAQVRFTDIYVYREGRWRAVAAQETLVNEAKK